MPELPEVETVKCGLEQAVLGHVIAKVTLNRPDIRVPITQSFQEKTQGAVIQNLIRRGKYIIALLDNGHGFVLHLGMSGRIHIYAPGQTYEPAKHDHVVFETEEGAIIVFNDPRRFGMLYLTPADSWEEEEPFKSMGPEPLGNGFSAEALHDKLKNKRSPIKTALLDQKVVAGAGNIYVCEALYDSGIHPEALSCDLTLDQLEKLVPALKDVLQRAIESGGSSLKDYQKTDGSLGYFQYSFSVYDREGDSCPSCDCDLNRTGGVQRFTQSGRSTFYCPQKQKVA